MHDGLRSHPNGGTAARLELLLAAALFSTGAAVIKWVPLEGLALSGLRSGIAAITLLLLIPAARRRPAARVIPVAVAYAATVTLYVVANKLTTALNTIFLQSTAPLYLLLLGPWLLREPLRRRDLLTMAALGLGFGLFFVAPTQATTVAENPRLGNLLAAASGLSWALTLAGLRWLSRRGEASGGPSAVVLGNGLACLVGLPFLFPLPTLTMSGTLAVGYLGVAQVGLAYVILLRGMRRVTAFEASLLLLLEPVLNPIWTWLVHGERPSNLALAGAGIILLATVVKALLDRRSRGQMRPVPPSPVALGSSGRDGPRDPA